MPTARCTYDDIDEAALLRDLAAMPVITDEATERQAAEDDDASTSEELHRAEMTISTVIGDRIRRVRARLAMSQAEFASRFGLSAESVRMYEAGQKQASWAVARFLWLVEMDPELVADNVARVMERRRALQRKAG